MPVRRYLLNRRHVWWVAEELRLVATADTRAEWLDKVLRVLEETPYDLSIGHITITKRKRHNFARDYYKGRASEYSCITCGDEADSWHHFRPGDPDAVVPLCDTCHGQEHRRLNSERNALDFVR